MCSPGDAILRALGDESLVHLAAKVCGLAVVRIPEGVRILSRTYPLSAFEVKHDADSVTLLKHHAMEISEVPAHMGHELAPYSSYFPSVITFDGILGEDFGVRQFLRILRGLSRWAIEDALERESMDSVCHDDTGYEVSACKGVDTALSLLYALLSDEWEAGAAYSREGARVTMGEFAVCILRVDSIVMHMFLPNGARARRVLAFPPARGLRIDLKRMEFAGWASLDHVLVWLYSEFTSGCLPLHTTCRGSSSRPTDTHLQWLRFQAGRRIPGTRLDDELYPTHDIPEDPEDAETSAVGKTLHQ
jgi:hypothetical protein